MIVFICLFCGDEMVSDSYPDLKGDADWNSFNPDWIKIVQAKYITKKDGEVDIGAGNAFGGGEEEAVDDEGVTVINLVEAHKL